MAFYFRFQVNLFISKLDTFEGCVSNDDFLFVVFPHHHHLNQTTSTDFHSINGCPFKISSSLGIFENKKDEKHTANEYDCMVHDECVLHVDFDVVVMLHSCYGTVGLK